MNFTASHKKSQVCVLLLAFCIDYFSIYHFRILLCSPEGHLGSWPSLRQQKLLVLLLQHFSMGDLRKHQQYIFTLENSFSSLEGKSSLDSQQLLPNMFFCSPLRGREKQPTFRNIKSLQNASNARCCGLNQNSSTLKSVQIPITRMNFIMHGALMLSFQMMNKIQQNINMINGFYKEVIRVE